MYGIFSGNTLETVKGVSGAKYRAIGLEKRASNREVCFRESQNSFGVS